MSYLLNKQKLIRTASVVSDANARKNRPSREAIEAINTVQATPVSYTHLRAHET